MIGGHGSTTPTYSFQEIAGAAAGDLLLEGRALQHAILSTGDRTVSTYQRPRVSSLASWHCALSVRAAPDGGVQQFRVERDYVQVTGRAMSPRNTGTVRQASSPSGTARRRLGRRRSRVFNAISPSRRASGAPRQ